MMLIGRLLRKHTSGLQLAGFFVANLVGVAVILAAVQVYRDVRPVVDAPDSFMANDYMILSKRVEGLGTGLSAFSPEELQLLSSQPFIEALGEFTPARYTVTGGVSVMGTGFESYMFFESVPDRFLDVEPDDWRFDDWRFDGETDTGNTGNDTGNTGNDTGDIGDGATIPIILPRNYLNLYNFGFASTQGLPQVSEELVSAVGLRIEIAGNGLTERFTGRVVAFSNRLNTILVPEGFIRWSNRRFASRPAAAPSRVIVEVPNSSDGNLHAYLAGHGYIAEGDRRGDGRMSYLLRVATAVVGGVGVVITALSVFVLMLSIFLLLQKNTKKLEDLLLLGYSEEQVSRPYRLLTLGLNLLVLVCAIPLVIWVRARYLPYVAMLSDGFRPAPLWVTLLWGLLAVALVTLLNTLAIRSRIKKLWWQ